MTEDGSLLVNLLHIDKSLFHFVEAYGPYVYLLFFIIIFCETGIVIAAFLPGESLIFTAGTLAGMGELSFLLCAVVFYSGTVLGDTVSFFIGKGLGRRIFSGRIGFLNPEKLRQARGFFQRHGGKTVLIARFIPFLRSLTPFIAGASAMHYGRFLIFSLSGAAVWVGVTLTAGYYLSGNAFFRDHFNLLLYAVMFGFLIPLSIVGIRALIKRTGKRNDAGQKP